MSYLSEADIEQLLAESDRLTALIQEKLGEVVIDE